MKKTIAIVFVLTCLYWSCVSPQAISPTLYVENLPQTIIAEMSLDERILTEEAWSDLKDGEGERAKKKFMKLGTESALYYAGLGYALYLLEDTKSAEDFFKASLQFYPDLVLIHVGLAQIYEETGREDSAFSEYRSILKIESEHSWAKPRYESFKNSKTADALREGRQLYSAGQTERSKSSYLKALFYSPASPDAHFALALIYRDENSLQNALLHVKAANATNPSSGEILTVYGDILFDLQDFTNSLQIYEKVLEKEPDNKQILERIEVLKNRLGLFELPSQYENIPNRQSISREDIAALMAVKFKDVLEAPSAKPPIIVDIATSWAARYILELASLGLLDVYSNHEFLPQETISRAQLAETLVRLIMYLEQRGKKFIQQIPPERIQIADVTPSNYYFRPILAILAYDIMALSVDKKFRPNDPVSGAEAIRLFNIIAALIR